MIKKVDSIRVSERVLDLVSDAIDELNEKVTYTKRKYAKVGS